MGSGLGLGLGLGLGSGLGLGLGTAHLPLLLSSDGEMAVVAADRIPCSVAPAAPPAAPPAVPSAAPPAAKRRSVDAPACPAIWAGAPAIWDGARAISTGDSIAARRRASVR